MVSQYTYSRLKPIAEMNNVRMVKLLQHHQLIVHHLLMTFDVLFQNDLDGHSLSFAFCFADYAICTSAQGSPESISGPVSNWKD